MIVVEILNDDVTTDGVREESGMSVPNEIVPAVSVKADDGLQFQTLLIGWGNVAFLKEAIVDGIGDVAVTFASCE